jgi:hypothetical protein
MKKTYAKNQKSKSKNQETKPQEWAVAFLEENFEYASSSILADFRQLDETRQAQVEQYAVRLLADKRLKQNEKLRSGAIRLIVALLPKTFPILEKILFDCSAPLWYEVHFTAFSALDRGDLSEADQNRVLTLVEQYLVNAKSEAGFAAWKAGDTLGDEWYAPETVEILETLLSSARYTAGRNAALHGIQHAMNEATPSEKERLVSLVGKVASEDPSAEVRDYATYTLTNGGCSRNPSGKRVTA